MENVTFSLADVQYLLFIIPGFILVWTYRFFSSAKNIGEFEYAGLSFIWGFLLVAVFGFITSKFFPSTYQLIIKNVYSATLWFSFFGLITGWFGSFVVRWKWVKKSINYLRPENFGK